MADKLLEILEGMVSKATLEVDGQQVNVTLQGKRFSTGSAGWHYQGKLEGQDGRRYQVQIQAVVIGSKVAP